ncbi:MAG: hypothetical protein JWM47_2299 [Acidimicrobiales bacterium]|nr:hypothetical protein [Acidimicrobiales bacterium]
MGTGPAIIGYDGSPAAERALTETAVLLAGRSGLVVCVWEPGLAYQMLLPGFVPAPIDVRVALAVDEAIYDQARRLAEQGASRARDLGLEAEGLAVADELTPAQTLVRLATERDAAAVSVGRHGHGAVRELLLGSTSHDVVRHAPCPVVLVHAPVD